ncbi:hypothetical protein [Streptomyces subrutilus]|uniref:Uncharacterized protein n=1 Tax=Streptomyces subrutilus TaxID=36818 RepID=A0A5P2UMR5_9ACTN|nr:hypothetical protein [Streptomyces subrutilus]QEU80448.1 hypothetical protein CP968_21035 [Streptomyces subrutilus]WSJ30255.1 hypothetical protein OG479_13620 [Streptomyces subrutilus]
MGVTLGRYVCGAQCEARSSELVALLNALAAQDDTYQVGASPSITLRCTLETHAGLHAEMVHDNARGLCLWVWWADGAEPAGMRWVPDCPVNDPGPGGDACCHHLGHKGGHTWELSDPDRDMLAAIAPVLYEEEHGAEWPFF